MPHMTVRATLLLLGASLMLSACADWAQCRGYGPCTGKVLTGPYDQSDLYEDAQGNPLPGWEQMIYGPEADGDH